MKGLWGFDPSMDPTASNLTNLIKGPYSGAQVSLEMDDESEDEVEALAEMYDPDCSSDGTYRFALLRELWASAR